MVKRLAVMIFEIKMVCVTMAPCVYFILANIVPVLACQAIANVLKSSLGPVGLDKMLVDDIGVCLSFY